MEKLRVLISVENLDTGGVVQFEEISILKDYKNDENLKGMVAKYKDIAEKHNFSMGAADIDDEVTVVLAELFPRDAQLVAVINDYIC